MQEPIPADYLLLYCNVMDVPGLWGELGCFDSGPKAGGWV